MKKSKKRVFKLMGWIFLMLAVLIIIGYFIFSYLRLNNRGIPQDYFNGKVYITIDGQTVLRFSDGAERATLRTSDSTYLLTVQYTENIFILADTGRTFEYIVLDDSTLYSGNGYYLYLYGGLQ